MKYEGPNLYQSKDMANVKVFADKQTTNGRTYKRMGQKLHPSDLSMRGHKDKTERVEFSMSTSTMIMQIFESLGIWIMSVNFFKTMIQISMMALREGFRRKKEQRRV